MLTRIKHILTLLFKGEFIDSEVEHENTPDIYTKDFSNWYRYIKQNY